MTSSTPTSFGTLKRKGEKKTAMTTAMIRQKYLQQPMMLRLMAVDVGDEASSERAPTPTAETRVFTGTNES